MSEEQNALMQSLDSLPMGDLKGYSEEYFDSNEDARRVPSFDGKFLIVKVLNDTQLFSFMNEHHEDFTGVIVEFHLTKSWYEKAFALSGGGNRPDCYSNDSIVPRSDSSKKQSDKCALCPRNQFEPDPTREGKKKKDCSDTITLYIWNPRFDKPLLLKVSTMNRKRISDFIKMIGEKGIAKELIVCKFSLFKDNETASIEFSGLKLQAIGSVPNMTEFFADNEEERQTWFGKTEPVTSKMIVERIVQFKNENDELFTTEGAIVSAGVDKSSDGGQTEPPQAGPDLPDDETGEPPF